MKNRGKYSTEYDYQVNGLFESVSASIDFLKNKNAFRPNKISIVSFAFPFKCIFFVNRDQKKVLKLACHNYCSGVLTTEQFIIELNNFNNLSILFYPDYECDYDLFANFFYQYNKKGKNPYKVYAEKNDSNFLEINLDYNENSQKNKKKGIGWRSLLTKITIIVAFFEATIANHSLIKWLDQIVFTFCEGLMFFVLSSMFFGIFIKNSLVTLFGLTFGSMMFLCLTTNKKKNIFIDLASFLISCLSFVLIILMTKIIPIYQCVLCLIVPSFVLIIDIFLSKRKKQNVY